MAPPFLRLSLAEFSQAVAGFAWPRPKTAVHVHHTWRPNHAQYRGLPTIQAMYDFHTRNNGWSDIAQHISIGPDGSIWTGRPWGASPASAAGHNGGHVFMFETIGDFDRGKDPLAGAQLEAVLHVVATLQERFGLPADGSILFHNQVSGKTCPGSSVDRAAFVAMVAERRAALRERGAPAAAVPEAAMAAIAGGGAEAAGEDGEAEIAHDETLAAFMAEHTANPFATRQLAATESLAMARLPQDVDALFAELGRRAALIEADPALAGDLDPASGPVPEAFLSSFADLGRRIFARVEAQLHALMCGTGGEDAADRARLRDAFGLGGDALTGAIVAVLTGSFGLAPAIAAVVAAILLRVVLKPAYAETCAYWGERLAP